MNTSALQRFFQQEDLNFLVTNRIPRIAVTRAMGWFSQIRSPLLARLSIAVWQVFTELDLSDAKKHRFESLHDCFTRELLAGARPVDGDPGVLTSPCDAIVGELGRIEQGRLYQAKGMPYAMRELFGPAQELQPFEGGQFLTLRLTSAMYHRFHAPDAARLEHVSYLSGDCWNVNPIALKRVERLFCRNERAVLRMRLADGTPLAIVPVAAVLVASIRLHALDVEQHLRQKSERSGAHEWPCEASYERGQEMGWFQHGSTLIVFVPPGFEPAVHTGQRLRMGQALMRRV
ncbi:MAG: phosphatidylserine decarboxylase [Paucibacter sp.]|nr:phosphatidylserine decarboxylase [Roseateles sp.]